MVSFKNKKVLIFGLGILGGGVATAKWFYKKGAKLKITDLKTKKELSKSLNKLKNIKAEYVLGKHRQEDIDSAEIIVFNPGVSYHNQFVKYALEKNKVVENDCSLFFKYAQGEIIAITGTRGKTTTTNWIYQFLKSILKNKKIIIGGNQPDKSLLKLIDQTNKNSLSVVEISSFQLEFYPPNIKGPKIAIITNILNDHLNRYKDFEEYASIKAKIFQNQKEEDYLILNYDNSWTKFFLKLKPKSQVYFVSLKRLPSNLKGVFVDKNEFYLKDENLIYLFNVKKFKEVYGEHNLYNLLFSFLATYLYLKDKFKPSFIFKKLKSIIFQLKTPEFREQIIFQKKNLIIINDSASTTPDACLAGIRRFFNKKGNFILITGGTDKNLDFQYLAKEIKSKIKPENLILLNGSATQNLVNALKKIKYKIDEKNIFDKLEDCLKKALAIVKPKTKNIILFSPASASFEKFKNEFDRGKKFNQYCKKVSESLLKAIYLILA